jgi:hypothetical protein
MKRIPKQPATQRGSLVYDRIILSAKYADKNLLLGERKALEHN